MATIKIKSSHPSQGEYVIIEEGDFNADTMTKYVEPSNDVPKEGSKEWICAQLDAAGIEYDKAASKSDLKATLEALGG